MTDLHVMFLRMFLGILQSFHGQKSHSLQYIVRFFVPWHFILCGHKIMSEATKELFTRNYYWYEPLITRGTNPRVCVPAKTNIMHSTH